MDFKTFKGLLGQYISDAQPGGLLNPEVPPGGPTQLAKGLLGLTPGVGDAISAYDAVQSAREGDWAGAALNGVGVLPFVPSMAGVIGKHHSDVLGSIGRGLPDNVMDSAFGKSGNLYATPLRPFENAQASGLGVKTNPIAERVFSSDSPINAKSLAGIEAVPISSESIKAFSKELADEGVMAMMHKDGKRMTVLMPSTKGKGFQMTEFDPKGALGDSQHATQEDAIQRMIEMGYSKIVDQDRAAKMLDRIFAR